MHVLQNFEPYLKNDFFSHLKITQEKKRKPFIFPKNQQRKPKKKISPGSISHQFCWF